MVGIQLYQYNLKEFFCVFHCDNIFRAKYINEG